MQCGELTLTLKQHSDAFLFQTWSIDNTLSKASQTQHKNPPQRDLYNHEQISVWLQNPFKV